MTSEGLMGTYIDNEKFDKALELVTEALERWDKVVFLGDSTELPSIAQETAEKIYEIFN